MNAFSIGEQSLDVIGCLLVTDVIFEGLEFCLVRFTCEVHRKNREELNYEDTRISTFI